jgi:hypothetical protein
VCPVKRLTASQALAHAWIAQRLDAPADLSAARDKLRRRDNPHRFKARSTLTAAQRHTSRGYGCFR